MPWFEEDLVHQSEHEYQIEPIARDGAPRKPLYIAPAAADAPDICEAGGQRIDKRSPASMEPHSTPRHLPYTGKRNPYRR